MVTNWHLHWAKVVQVNSPGHFSLPELAEPFQGNVVLLVSVSEVSEVSKIIEIKRSKLSFNIYISDCGLISLSGMIFGT